MPTVGTSSLWAAFTVIIAVALTVDLAFAHRRPHEVRFREAVGWSLVWIALSLAFGGWIWLQSGGRAGLEFLTGWVLEKALSVDNLFVFVVLFEYFRVPARLQHKVLFWGILGAILTRGLFVAVGIVLIHYFEWILELFGLFLLVTGIRFVGKREAQADPEHSAFVHWLERHLPVTSRYADDRFVTRVNGAHRATPLLLALLSVEATDVMFAVDSIPAVFGVTRDPFLVFTSNIFAVLGLRALYFVLRDLMGRLVHLHHGLGLVLAFIGLKMLLHRFLEVPVGWSLVVVAALIGGSIVTSWLASHASQR